ncbi:hypothetical protein [Planctobacterium marinum]|uniref:Uncharacterized protein n=1 Tax=Planctobacterium marinum TaxID=1631968 RepID=A0AA48HR02_9ALTE|nr:hypothetical protein MACH26_19100 [Planctobacterium marinum]
MKTLFFIVAVAIAAGYLMFQTPKGRELIEDYLPLARLTEEFQQITASAQQPAKDYMAKSDANDNEEQIGQRKSGNGPLQVFNLPALDELQQRLVYLEHQVAHLTQQKNGYSVQNSQKKTVVEKPVDLNGEINTDVAQINQVDTTQQVNAQQENAQLDTKRARQLLLQGIAEKQHMAALNGMTE